MGQTVSSLSLSPLKLQSWSKESILTPANSHSMLFPTILFSINKKRLVYLHSFLMEHCFFYLVFMLLNSCTFVWCRYFNQLCKGFGVLWFKHFKVLRQETTSTPRKQIFKIIIYDNFEHLHSTSPQISIMARWLVFFLNSLESLITVSSCGVLFPVSIRAITGASPP